MNKDQQVKNLFPKNALHVIQEQLKNLIKLQKVDAVRRCSSEDYYCDKISIEKLKHFVSAFNIDDLKKLWKNFGS